MDIIMPSNEKRNFILIFDMLAGHWLENIIVPATKLPPPNVIGYAKRGLLPTFLECIEQGVFVHAWNNGICNTPYGQKYLASGTYRAKSISGNSPYLIMTEGAERDTIITACQKKHPEGKTASFGSDEWVQTGWWKARDCTMGFGGYYSDFLTMQSCFKWMSENPEWKMVLLYLPQYDLTGNCPVYKKNVSYTQDKHHSLLQLDRYLWMVKTFLTENGWWEKTCLSIASDHGCHYGCNVSVKEGRERKVAEKDLDNYCSNHQEPHNCFLWDFEKNRKTSRKLDCCRRITFILSGGLVKKYRGKIISNAEIIDFAPTLAYVLNLNMQADGKNLFA